MKLTTDQIQTLIKSPEFQALPFQLAQEDGGHNAWWLVMDRAVEEASRLTIWQATQHIALLFDTYGDAIDDVTMDLDITQDRNDIYFSATLSINGNHCFDGSIELEDDAMAIIDQVDGRHALEVAVSELNDISNNHLMTTAALMKDALNKTFLSADEAWNVGREFAPRIEAWARQRLLESEVASTARGRGPASKM